MGYASNNAPFAPKPKTPPPPKKDNHAKDAICHQCGEVGHWRRNCPVYLAKLMKKKKLSQGASTSGIFTIELYSFLSKSWIFDTGCGTHICITTQGLRGSKKLKPSALSMYVGDGHRAAVEAIRTYHLDLPSISKEVENQLEKTIKSLRSDRGGEYMCQEFLDHLKEHGIFAHRTPAYTSQNNKVSERRNQTLLDMVRSMMSQTTLPKSFWDYALETAARILNMVPTKKVDKTPYEIWHGTSLNHEEDDQEIKEPQSDINPIRKSSRTRRAPDRMCLYIDAEEHDSSCSKGLHSNLRVDYEETFSPVADIRAIRILIAIAAYYDYEIWKIDVKTAFLNGHLSEEVYMEQPEGFVNLKYPNHNMTSRFQQNPGEEHWTAVKNILKYLRSTKDMFLVYGGLDFPKLKTCDGLPNLDSVVIGSPDVRLVDNKNRKFDNLMMFFMKVYNVKSLKVYLTIVYMLGSFLVELMERWEAAMSDVKDYLLCKSPDVEFTIFISL
nr:retrotransposon protein, putative, Ty1-copia subclass [Tanacetum cinerariifolium]